MAYNHENYSSDPSRRSVVPSNGVPRYPRTMYPVQESGELSTPYPTMNLATTPVSSHNNHYARGHGNFGYTNNPQFPATVPNYLEEVTAPSDLENIQYFSSANPNAVNHALHSAFLAQGPPCASQVPMVQQVVNYASSASEITSPGFSLPSPYGSSVNTPLSQISSYGNEESMTIVPSQQHAPQQRTYPPREPPAKAPKVTSKNSKPWIAYDRKNRAAKEFGLTKGPCIHCMILELECRGRHENKRRCDRCLRENITSYCRGPVTEFVFIDLEGEWNPSARQLREDLNEGLAHTNEQELSGVDLIYTWLSDSTVCLHQRRLEWSDGQWVLGNPMPSAKFFPRRYYVSDLERACRSFILNLNILRSPSLITVQVQCEYLTRPSQVFSIIQDFGIQAQFLLQEIHDQVEMFLKEKEKTKPWFPREAFNLGLVWKELNNFITIPDDWRRLGGLKLLMDPLVVRARTVMEHIKSIGGAIHEAEFEKGQRHYQEDFQGIHIKSATHSDITDATSISVQDILLRRRPHHSKSGRTHSREVAKIIAHHEREVEHHEQELDRHNKALADLRATKLSQVNERTNALAEIAPLMQLSGIDGFPRQHDVSYGKEGHQSSDRMSIDILAEASSDNAISTALYKPNDVPKNGDALMADQWKRKQTDSVCSNVANIATHCDKTPANFDSSTSACHDASPPYKKLRIEAAGTRQDIMSRVGSSFEYRHQEQNLSNSNTSQNQASYPPNFALGNQFPMELEFTERNLDQDGNEFANAIWCLDQTCGNLPASLSPHLKSQHPDETPVEDDAQFMKKNRFSVRGLVEIFRDKSRPASYPRKSTRRSIYNGIQNLTNWLNGIHIGDFTTAENRPHGINSQI